MSDVWTREARKYEELAQDLSADDRLHFILHEWELQYLTPDQAAFELVLKKGALYAAHTILVTQAHTYYENQPSETPTEPTMYSTICSMLADLGVARPKQLFHVVPETVRTYAWPGDENYVDSDLTTRFSFRDAYHNPVGVPLSFRDERVRSHILERLNCSASDLSIVQVWLPELRHVPLETLLRLREDEADAFTRFQYSLRTLLNDLGDDDGSEKIKEVFQRVDYEVRTFENKMRSLARLRSLQIAEAAVGFTVAGLCLAAPSPVSTAISAALGAYKASDFVKNLFRQWEERTRLKQSDFYLPWLCTRHQAAE